MHCDFPALAARLGDEVIHRVEYLALYWCEFITLVENGGPPQEWIEGFEGVEVVVEVEEQFSIQRIGRFLGSGRLKNGAVRSAEGRELKLPRWRYVHSPGELDSVVREGRVRELDEIVPDSNGGSVEEDSS